MPVSRRSATREPGEVGVRARNEPRRRTRASGRRPPARPTPRRARSSSGRLVDLDPAAPERRAELDEAEVADEPVAEAPEPFERDHAERPRAEPALAQQPRLDRLDRSAAQPLEVERAADADERRGPVRREAEPAQLAQARAPRSPRAVGAGSPIARRIPRSIASARLASISWPQIARRSACATVARRSGRSPCRRRIDGPSSGSFRKRCENSVVSASSARQKRSSSSPSSSGARRLDEPVGALPRLAATAAGQRLLELASVASSGAGDTGRAVLTTSSITDPHLTLAS